MKSLKSLESAARTLTTAEMVNTKGGNGYSIVISAQLDICAVNTTTGTVETLYCDRRKRTVGAGQ